MVSFAIIAILVIGQPWLVNAAPTQVALEYTHYYDVQGHRGGRGEAIENSLPSFSWGLIDGVTTLELDNGITKDGVVVVWHDENIVPEKCKDTAPVVANDPIFPYVGKYIANLTFTQLRTLDCGSERLNDYPFQLTYPGTKISTLQELFEFADCADPGRKILWNIESKIDAAAPNLTLGVQEFVQKQHAIFEKSGRKSAITYQSFDWRSIVEMKKLDPKVITSALLDANTVFGPGNTTSPWLAGLNPSNFTGPTFGEQIAQAAHAVNADVLSPAAISSRSLSLDPAIGGYVPFTTKEMIAEAHKLGLKVKPWTVDRINIVDQLLGWGADGIITDYPAAVRRFVQEEKGLPVAPGFPKDRVLKCLNEALKKQH